MDCGWLIHGSRLRPIDLIFHSFDTEAGFDFVDVYEGIGDTLARYPAHPNLSAYFVCRRALATQVLPTGFDVEVARARCGIPPRLVQRIDGATDGYSKDRQHACPIPF